MPSQAEMFGIPLSEQIACVEREIKMRERVYPNRVATRRMSQAKADIEVVRMKAVLETLRRAAMAPTAHSEAA